MYDETKGEFVANSDDVKYLKTTNRLTVVNDREKHLYFRIVPASVSYNPENDKNSQYNDNQYSGRYGRRQDLCSVHI